MSRTVTVRSIQKHAHTWASGRAARPHARIFREYIHTCRLQRQGITGLQRGWPSRSSSRFHNVLRPVESHRRTAIKIAPCRTVCQTEPIIAPRTALQPDSTMQAKPRPGSKDIPPLSALLRRSPPCPASRYAFVSGKIRSGYVPDGPQARSVCASGTDRLVL